MDLKALKDLENEYMKNLIHEFIHKLKKENPYYSSAYTAKVAAMEEFFEFFKNREKK